MYRIINVQVLINFMSMKTIGVSKWHYNNAYCFSNDACLFLQTTHTTHLVF